MTTVQRRRPGARKGPDMDKIVKHFTRFRELKRAEKAAKEEHERLRDEELMPALIEYGQAHGEKGQHLAIELPEPVDGLTRLVRRANTSHYVDVDKAEEMAKKGGYLEDIQVGVVQFQFVGTPEEASVVRALLEKAKVEKYAPIQHAERFDQDRLMAFHQTHREPTRKGDKKVLTEDQLDSLMVEETTYSFFPER